jgi:excisionase family DNA binding protein
MTGIHSIGFERDDAFVVSPRRACQLLAIGRTRLYELLAAGELVTYKEGRSRKITAASIQARIARKIDQAASGQVLSNREPGK